MKISIKNILGFTLAIIVGLIAGYYIFGNSKSLNERQQDHGLEEHTVYTCSMHPQIRQNEIGLCPICEMDLVPIEKFSSTNPTKLEMTEAAVQLANIQTTIIGSREHTSKEMQFNGKIQIDESRDASLVAHIPGRIESLNISFTGEQVSKGQRIATIYSPDLITAQRELIEAKKIEDLSPQLLNAARNKMRFWKISNSTIAEIEQSGTIRETFGVYAGQSGIVKMKKVSVGDYVQQGQVLFDIQNLNNLWVLFEAYEDQIPHVQIGDKVTFKTPAFPEKNFTTRIAFIDPIINPTTRVAMLRAEINNTNGDLKPEMFVTGIISVKQNETSSIEQLLVPKSAVLWTGNKSVVYIKDATMSVPTFEYRNVVIGNSIGEHYSITEGLISGDEVVTNGAFSIDAAAQLNNQSSMMNKHVVKQETKEWKSVTEQFKVFGNCSMCKDRIEETAQSAPYVYSSIWNMDTKELTIQYDSANVSIADIQQLIASVGHDTELFRADDDIYEDLSSCCKYERPLNIHK